MSAYRVQSTMKTHRKGPRTYPIKEVLTLLGIKLRKEAKADTRPASEKQIAYLEGKGVSGADRLTFGVADAVIEELMDRYQNGLGTLRQIGFLVSYGIDPEEARQVPFAEIIKMINEACASSAGGRS